MVKNEKYLYVNFLVDTFSYCYNCVKGHENFDIKDNNLVEYNPKFPNSPGDPCVGYIFNLGKENNLKCEYDKFPDKSGEILEIKPNHYSFKCIEIF